MTQPNILIFMVDQLTSCVLKSYGGTVCKTPHLDALAERATLFENAYCPYPLCSPSRASMMAGRLPSRIGAFDNGAEMPAAVPTFAHYLRSAGYWTALSGKMHFVGPDQFHGFEERLTTEIYPADMSWTPGADFRDHGPGEDRGYTFGVSTIDTVKDAGPVARSMQIDYDEEVVHRATRALYDRARGDDPRPFLLTVSLTQPHDPYVTTQACWDLHPQIDPPRVAHIPVENRDPHSRSLYYHYGQDKCALTDEDYQRARRGYYGMIAHIDALFGRVMTVLEETGLAGDTAVIFTSDHGDMIGERGMWFKKTLFDPAIRVPLMLALPDTAPRRVAAPASLIDLFPTLLDLAGIGADNARTPLEGRSLLPACRGEALHGPVFFEHIDGGTSAPRVGLRDGDMKLVISRNYPPQLYDLSTDPTEETNLAGTGHPAEPRLTELAEAHWPLDRLLDEVIASQVARKLVDDALATGRIEPWDYLPGPSTQTAYVRRGDAFPDIEQRGYLPYPSERKG